MAKKTKNIRYVYLDTQVFIERNFQYATKGLARLAELIEDGRLQLFITNITVNEIKAHVLSSVKQARLAINEFRKTARILFNCKNPSYEVVFRNFDTTATEVELVGQLETFLDECKTTVIPINTVSIEAIFNKYFSMHPPFSEGEKKSEFPDAFVIAAIEVWCSENKKQMHVISGDGDWKAACENKESVIYLDKLEALFQLVEFDDRIISELSDIIFERHLPDIVEGIQYQFERMGFSVDNYDFSPIVDYVHAEEIEVNTVELQEKYLVKVDHEKLSFACQFNIDFSCEISYIDYTNAIYDHEDHKYYFGENVRSEIETSYIINVEVEISFSRENPDQSELDETKIIENEVIIVLRDAKDEAYPYK